jgi:hypothetical protein
MTTNCLCRISLISCLVLAPVYKNKSSGQQPPRNTPKQDKLITIQAGGTLGCKVDDARAKVYKSKQYARWKSADNDYCINFVDTPSPVGLNPIPVSAGQKTSQFVITAPIGIYKYEIWSQTDCKSSQHNKCKDAYDDHDTSLDVGN